MTFSCCFRILHGHSNSGDDLLSITELERMMPLISQNDSYFLGIHNVLMHGMCIPFFDFDCDAEDEEALVREKNFLFGELQEKMKRRRLDGFIYESRHGYHLVLNDIVTRGMHCDLMRDLGCCAGFKYFTISRGYATLRVTPKGEADKQFIKFIGRLNYTRKHAIIPEIIAYNAFRLKLESLYNQYQ